MPFLFKRPTDIFASIITSFLGATRNLTILYSTYVAKTTSTRDPEDTSHDAAQQRLTTHPLIFVTKVSSFANVASRHTIQTTSSAAVVTRGLSMV